ncbi:HAD-IIB family hydrolase [Actinomyces howellii]|uniref:Phosphatase YidA n=1 Tax=Actinomyces howellii TaxID=52771 RepID=A0A3S4TAU6_9ACTO|nr:HAD family hydrolase [Actinomyces howellii]VEG29414.1 Phosphatase YidA [Actinomyces howellii]
MPGLIATDLDGTILFDRRVSAADLAAMERWRAAGNLLVVNTGKSVFATRDTLGPAGVDFDYAVTFTGAVLIDSDYSILSARYLPDGLAREIVTWLEGVEGLTVFATTIERDHILSDTYGEVSPILQVFEPMRVEQMDGHRFIGVPMRVRDDDVRARLVEGMTERWGPAIEVVRNQEFLDVIPAGCTKGSGLTELLGRLAPGSGPGADQPPETWTIGDSWNDIPMHEVADHAVALPWSPPAVTEACERTVGSIAELIDSLLEGR